MHLSRRKFLKSSVATAVAAQGVALFGADAVFADGTVGIPSASHWGRLLALVKDGVLVGVQPVPELDAMPTTLLTPGLLDRVYDKTRVKHPMVRKSYLADPMGDT